MTGSGDRPRRYHVNGDLVPADEATVSVRDRGFLYGDAAFETLRAYGGTCFAWDAHERRLHRSCATLGMPEAVPADLRERVAATLAANDLADAYVRCSVTRGVQPGTLDPGPATDPGVVVIVSPLPRGGVTGERTWDEPAALRTVETRRVPDEAVPASAKTHNFLNGILARLELGAERADAGGAGDQGTPDEALLRTVDGAAAEGASSNVFFVADGVLRTPDLDGPVLPGVTRDVVLDLADELGVPAETGTYEVADLRGADELFLTNSTSEVWPVTRFDGERYPAGEVTRRLQAAYDERVERRHYGGDAAAAADGA